MPIVQRDFAILWCLFILAVSSLAQQPNFPKEIHGYKVLDAKVEIHQSPSDLTSRDAEARVSFGEPKFISASVAGITFDLPAEATALSVNGTIDLLEFHDFCINGIPVEIKEFKGPIAIKNGKTLQLPIPARIFVASQRVVQATWVEITDLKKEWLVTGRVFVFGKFKKMGMSFKRAIPIDIRITIKNPVPGLGLSPAVSSILNSPVLR